MASMAPAKKGSVMSRTMAPRSIVGAPLSARARGFGRYSSCRAVARTRSRVSCETGTWRAALLRMRDTVLRDTPVATAMSCMVVGRLWRPADRGLRPSTSVLEAAAEQGVDRHRDQDDR